MHQLTCVSTFLYGRNPAHITSEQAMYLESGAPSVAFPILCIFETFLRFPDAPHLSSGCNDHRTMTKRFLWTLHPSRDNRIILQQSNRSHLNGTIILCGPYLARRTHRKHTPNSHSHFAVLHSLVSFPSPRDNHTSLPSFLHSHIKSDRVSVVPRTVLS